MLPFPSVEWHYTYVFEATHLPFCLTWDIFTWVQDAPIGNLLLEQRGYENTLAFLWYVSDSPAYFQPCCCCLKLLCSAVCRSKEAFLEQMGMDVL